MYDYIIVGAGSAGCVLANRLTENSRNSVLLLEAGGPDTQREIHVPISWSLLRESALDWGYHTEPQAHLDGRRIHWPRGKVLGGSSATNAMMYVRGNPADYDHWASLGNEGWGYADLLPLFKKSENQLRGADEYHGVNGPLTISDIHPLNALAKGFIEAAVALGLPYNPDFNGPSQDGVGPYQATIANGRRQSTAEAYLRPALRRSNLTVRTHCHMMGLLYEGRRVAGVRYIAPDGDQREVRVHREVILCAGAINSPQLLLFAGIGPADHLRQMGVLPRFPLPGVGQNLQDHLLVGVDCFTKDKVALNSAYNWRNTVRYVLTKRGPLASNAAEAGGFYRTQPDLPTPDIQFIFLPAIEEAHGRDGFKATTVLLRPRSRGYIKLRSTDALDAPLIQPNYLADEADWAPLLAGVKMARQITRHPALGQYVEREVYPGQNVVDDEGLMAYIRQAAHTVYHPVGTCKMGPAGDKTAVVDAQLRVHGLEGLRVADASIMPTLIGGNTNAPVIMIAEKAAEMILGA